MRTSLLALLVFAAAAAAASAQADDAPARPPRKGDALMVKGCLSGTSLQATETSAPDSIALLAGGLLFRLTGKKDLLRDLREKHDRRIVEVRGTLKSDLPRPDTPSRTFGGMRIGVGAASPAAGRPDAESRRRLPVLEVKSFQGGDTVCGR